MDKYRIEYNKPCCIGCGVCAAISEKFWEMDEEEKSHLKDSKSLEGKEVWETREIEESDFKINIEAAEVCPVNVIHIKDKKGESVI